MKKKILIFCGYYLPGYKAGGPIRTIANMVELLSEYFEFYIVTGDRDANDQESYAHLKNRFGWQDVGNAKVLYLSPKEKTFRKIWHVIKKTPHDVLYINSFFSYNFSIKPLFLKRLGLLPNTTTILAPRGEFSEGALSVKRLKKRLFLTVSRLFGLHNRVRWHVSSLQERGDLLKNIKNLTIDQIHIAINLPDISSLSKKLDFVPRGQHDPLRVIFLSRVHPMKNLDFTIEILKLSNVKIIFDIYGLIDSRSYYNKCISNLDSAPSSIKYQYKGTVVHDDVVNVFSSYDLFILPTKGENYGHVILEALTAGTPALISDTTPWQDLEEKQAGWVVSLDNMTAFVEKVRYMSDLSPEQQLLVRERVQEYAKYHLLEETNIKENIRLFA